MAWQVQDDATLRWYLLYPLVFGHPMSVSSGSHGQEGKWCQTWKWWVAYRCRRTYKNSSYKAEIGLACNNKNSRYVVPQWLCLHSTFDRQGGFVFAVVANDPPAPVPAFDRKLCCVRVMLKSGLDCCGCRAWCPAALCAAPASPLPLPSRRHAPGRRQPRSPSRR